MGRHFILNIKEKRKDRARQYKRGNAEKEARKDNAAKANIGEGQCEVAPAEGRKEGDIHGAAQSTSLLATTWRERRGEVPRNRFVRLSLC